MTTTTEHDARMAARAERDAANRSERMEYLTRIPTDGIPAGKIVVHNHVLPAAPLGNYGFRAWLAPKTPKNVEICPCQWAPGLGAHYRVKRDYEPDEVVAARDRATMSRRAMMERAPGRNETVHADQNVTPEQAAEDRYRSRACMDSSGA